MKVILLASLLVLSGCMTTVPVKQPFPDAVPALIKRCEELKKVEAGKNSITDVLKVVVENYTLYHECSLKVDGWNEWYTEQKAIWEKVNKK